MARRISFAPHLTLEELEGRYRSTKDPVERSRWHFLWLLARGLTAKAIAGIIGNSAYWIGRIARRYNQRGPDGVIFGSGCAAHLLSHRQAAAPAGPFGLMIRTVIDHSYMLLREPQEP